jgi:hypothetical protein
MSIRSNNPEGEPLLCKTAEKSLDLLFEDHGTFNIPYTVFKKEVKDKDPVTKT